MQTTVKAEPCVTDKAESEVEQVVSDIREETLDERASVNSAWTASSQSAFLDKVFQCSKCTYRTSLKRNLKLHVISKHEGFMYSCDQCDYKNKWRKNVRMHIMAKHEGVMYGCDKCSYVTMYKGHLKTHDLTEHQGLTYDCDLCDYKAKQKVNLKNHVKSKHEQVTYSCLECNFVTGYEKDLKRHYKAKHKNISTLVEEKVKPEIYNEDLTEDYMDGSSLSPKLDGQKNNFNETLEVKKEPMMDMYENWCLSKHKGNDDTKICIEIKTEAPKIDQWQTETAKDMCVTNEKYPNPSLPFGDVKTDPEVNVNCDMPNKTKLKPQSSCSQLAENSKVFMCNRCEYTSNKKQSLELHVMSKHEGFMYSCSQCTYKNKWRSNLRMHVMAKHQGATYGCDKCSYVTSYKIDLKKHDLTEHQGLTYDCDLCDYKAKHKVNLKNHVKSKHEGVTYNCNECNYVTAYKKGLKRHHKTKHNEISTLVEEELKTEIYRKDPLEVYTERTVLNSNHDSQQNNYNKILDKATEPTDMCENGCLKGIKEAHQGKDDTEICMEIKTEAPVVKQWQTEIAKDVCVINESCPNLSQQSGDIKTEPDPVNVNGDSLVKNMVKPKFYWSQTEKNGKVFMCNMCEYTSKKKQTLKLHVRSKHEGFMYSCSQCDYKNKWRNNLRMHIMAKHEGVTYSCNKCSYVTTYKGHLKTHDLTEHQGLTYNCNLCDYKAKQKVNLKNHVKSKHEWVTYNCSECNFVTTYEKDLKRHHKTKHKEVSTFVEKKVKTEIYNVDPLEVYSEGNDLSPEQNGQQNNYIEPLDIKTEPMMDNYEN